MPRMNETYFRHRNKKPETIAFMVLHFPQISRNAANKFKRYFR